MDREREALDAYLRIFSPILLVAAVLPFDFVGSEPFWPWTGFLDATLPGKFAILAPGLCAVAFFTLSRMRCHKAVTAATVLALLGAGWLVGILTSLRPHPLNVFGHLADGLPPLFGRAFWLLVLGVSLLAAGVRLGARDFSQASGSSRGDAWKAARLMTGVGIALGLMFYLLPYRGTLPLLDLIGDIANFGGRLDDPMVLALAAGHALSLGPLVLFVLAITRLWRRAPESGGMLLLLLLAYLPILSLLVGIRSLVVQAGYTLLHIRAASLILAFEAGLALALSALVRSIWFEVPWMLGQLTRTDAALAAALTTNKLAGEIGRLNPLVRPFVRRRLALWNRAASSFSEATGRVPSAAAGLIQDRLDDESGGRERPPTDWPRWMRGNTLFVTGGGGLLLVGVLMLFAAHRQGVSEICRLRPPDRLLEDVFAEQIPAVVIALSRSRAAPASLQAYGVLADDLVEAERECAGIRAAVLDLIDLGGRGRLRLHSIWRARDRLNRLLRDCGIPYFVRGRIVPARARRERDLFYLLDYRVTGCKLYRRKGGNRILPVLLLTRVDRLNIVEQYVGATAEEEIYATILKDRLDELIDTRVGPLLQRDDSLGMAVRAGLAEAQTAPDQPNDDNGRLEHLLLDGLTRHELHHRWLGLQPEPPASIWALMSTSSFAAVSGVTSELGAFLGELGCGPAYARLRLALMLAGLAEPRATAGIHGRAMLILLARLFELDPSSPPKWLAASARLAGPVLAGLSDEELMTRLGALHRELFGLPIPVFEEIKDGKKPGHRYPPW